jgi:hypothetical protein
MYFNRIHTENKESFLLSTSRQVREDRKLNSAFISQDSPGKLTDREEIYKRRFILGINLHNYGDKEVSRICKLENKKIW